MVELEDGVGGGDANRHAATGHPGATLKTGEMAGGVDWSSGVVWAAAVMAEVAEVAVRARAEVAAEEARVARVVAVAGSRRSSDNSDCRIRPGACVP